MSTARVRLLEVHVEAVDYFAEALRSGKGRGPRDYLVRRGLAGIAEHPGWAVGYAPPRWTGLVDHLRAAGFADIEIRDAGLAVTTSRETLVDRFRDRLVLGIRDDDGDVVGFVGRCAPGAEGRTPKYLNSPHTRIFAKGQLLFGLSEQRNRLHDGVTPVIAEGPLDALAIAGLDTEFAGISACGTALRPAQAMAIRRATSGDTVITAYDGDVAGRRAAGAAFSSLSPLFESVLAASIPDGQDPASLLVAGPGSLAGTLRTATPLLDQIVDDVLGHYHRLDNAEARVCALHASTRLLADLHPRDVSRQVDRVSRLLELEPAEVTRDLLAAVTERRDQSTAERTAGAVHRTSRREHRHPKLGL